LDALTPVADDNNDAACQNANVWGSKVSFEAVGGTSYYIAVGDAGGAREKPFELEIAPEPSATLGGEVGLGALGWVARSRRRRRAWISEPPRTR
jgi:hypothetical protein